MPEDLRGKTSHTNTKRDVGTRNFNVLFGKTLNSKKKTWDGIAVNPPFSFERLKAIGNSTQLKMRLIEEGRLAKLT